MVAASWFDDMHGVRLGSSDLDTSVRFATQILGLELVRRDARRAYLRASVGHDHHVIYTRGDVGVESIAFDVASRTALDDVVTSLERGGHAVGEGCRDECDERYVRAMYHLVDPSGNRLELVQGVAPGGDCEYARDAGITSFSHVG